MQKKARELFNLWCSEHGKDEDDVRAMKVYPAGMVIYTEWLLENLFNTSTDLSDIQSRFVIGVDLSLNDSAYCLTRISNASTDPIMVKRIADRKELEEEVANIARYFNAKVIVQH